MKSVVPLASSFAADTANRGKTIFLGLLALATSASFAASPREPELMPQAASVRHDYNSHSLQADTLAALQARANPDLAWIDHENDGAETPIFLWIMQSPDRSRVSFTFDSPYWVLQADNPIQPDAANKPFWCLLNPDDLKRFPWGSEVSEFLMAKFIRDRIEFPQSPIGDPNQSYVNLLAESGRGARVFELVYCSTSGYGAHQELMKTYLIYASADGKYFQASEDLGHQGSSPHSGGHSNSDSFEFHVEWKPQSNTPPFAATVRQAVLQAPGHEGDDEPEYEYFREGKLVGSLPMHAQWRPEHFVESDGQLTLTRLAEALAFYYSYEEGSPRIAPSDRAKVKAEILHAWLTELQRLNPGVAPTEILPKGRRIVSVAQEDKFDVALQQKLLPRSLK